jgi:ElaB/YqjD/DUF883 family membrane-anchored ribosome-binding protein
MTTANEAFKRAANSPAGRHAAQSVDEAAEAARDLSDQIGEFASDMSRQASKQFGRAREMAVDAYDEVHEASVRNPHISLALALGLGFLLGVVAAGRR